MNAIRGTLILALAAASTVANADIFHTPGPFASYTLVEGTAGVAVTQYSTDWLTGSGATQYFTDHGASLGAGLASVAARGAAGWAQAGVTASGTGYSPVSWAGWTDQISVNVAGLAGQHGTLTFSLAYDWQTPVLNATQPGSTADGWAEIFADVNLNIVGASSLKAQYQFAGQMVFLDCGGSCTTEGWNTFAQLGGSDLSQDKAPVIANGLITYSLDVVFGEQYFLTVGMNADIVGHNGSGSIDPSNSISWAGLLSIRDSNGQIIDSNSVAMNSALGFDFSQAVTAVPEPQSAMLFLAGLTLLGGMRRRWR